MAVEERDVFGAPFKVGDYVMVRCAVTSIATSGANGTGGAGDSVTLTVESPGNVGEKVGVTLVVSPIQCRRTGSKDQA
jgi:hypothetical protein